MQGTGSWTSKREGLADDSTSNAAPVDSGAVTAQARHDRAIVNGMSVDVEEHFQVSAFEGHLSRDEWPARQSRVARNVDRILAIFAEADTSATFFVLGCVAERDPGIVRAIDAAGHEVASHGFWHRRVSAQSRQEFADDISRTRQLLQDITGKPVKGYRAPSFSIGPDTPWAHDVLCEAGYQYSSSVFPVRHDHYGVPDAPRFPYKICDGKLTELPLTTVRVFGRNLPCAGGGYFRLFPYSLYRRALRRFHASESMPGAFYFHPWELDPGQPREQGLPLKSRFRHYVNLGKFEGRLRQVLSDFSWDRLDRAFGKYL